VKTKLYYPAVYCITCTPNGKFYVGASSDFHERINRHGSSLKSGNHHCKEMQLDYDKYGEAAFEATILELAEATLLPERELFWMNKLNAIEHGYNTTESAHHHAIDNRAPFFAVSPNGLWQEEFRGINEMAERLGVSYEAVAGMKCGKYPHVCGWTMPDAQRIKLYDQNGGEHSFASANAFREMHGNINIYGLVSGQVKSSKGWTLSPVSDKSPKEKGVGTQPSPITMIDPYGKEITFPSRKDAVKFIGTDKSNFNKAIKAGKRIKGWEAKTK
jgi:group I intron endonuclease